MAGRIKNTIRSSAIGVAKTIVTIVGQFIVRSFLIWKLGNEYVGLDSLFVSVLNVLNITELGFGSAMCFAMYKPVAERDTQALNALINLNKKICRYIGVIITILGLAITPFLRFVINKDVPTDINIYPLYFTFLFNAVIGYYLFAYTVSVVNAFQRNDLQSIASILSCILKYAAQIIALVIFVNYWMYVVFIPVSTIIDNIIRYYLMKKALPHIECKGNVPEDTKKEIKKQVFALFGHRLNGTIINSADNIVISAFLGLIVLGKYNNYYYILNALTLFFAVFFEAVRPSIGNSYLQKSSTENYRIFRNISFSMQWMTGWVSICLLCLYQPFIRIWTGEEGLLPFSTVIYLALLFYEGRNFDLLTVFKDAAGLWWEDRYRPYTASIANLIINILLVRYIGLNGVIISTIATRVIISWPWISSVLFSRVFKIGYVRYFLGFGINSMLIMLVGLLTHIITSSIEISSDVLSLICKIGICIFVPNLLLFIVFHRTKIFKECTTLILCRYDVSTVSAK